VAQGRWRDTPTGNHTRYANPRDIDARTADKEEMEMGFMEAFLKLILEIVVVTIVRRKVQ
jgi:hypothetical protein